MGVSMGMDMGMGMGMPGAVAEEEGMFMSFFHSLPVWAQGISLALAVIIAAWIAGIIIGKLYASVKYPDPEKPSLVNPLLKIGLGAAIIVCGFWIYSSFTKPDEPVMNDTASDGEVTEDISSEDAADNSEIVLDMPAEAVPDLSAEAEAVPAVG